MQRFELGDRRWAIEVKGDLVKIAWGQLGRAEQRHDRKLASHEAAAAYAEMQIAKQRELGYTESIPPPAKPVPDEDARDERPTTRSIRFEIAAETQTEFRRFPKPAQFLEVEQRGRALVEWSGESEHPDDPEKSPRRETTFATIAEASDAYDEEVQSAREGGWRQIRSSTIGEARTEPALEAQCWAASNDPAPWAVYADWLLEQGDPLGELATCPADGQANSWFGSELLELGIAPEHVSIERIHGFPRRASIKLSDEEEPDPIMLADAARAVRKCSSGRFIDSLRFGLAGYTDKNDWAPTLRALAEAPHPDRIRELRFDDYVFTDCEISWATMGDLAGLFAPFTRLELLHLKSGAGGTLGELDLPRLRTLIRESGGLAASEITAITTASWPKLRHLEIWFGSPNYGGDSTVASIRSILDAKNVPRLRHLGIVNCTWVEDAIDALAHSKILPQLHSLDLSKGILARRGVALFREHAAAFRHLASIDLTHNLLASEEAEQIRDVLDNVIVCDQRERELDDYEEDEAEGEMVRYVAVGE